MHDVFAYYEIYEYLSLFGWSLPAIAFFWGIGQLKEPQRVLDSSGCLIFLFLYLVCIMTLSPGASTDKGVYLDTFFYIFRTGTWTDGGKDVVFYFFAYCIGVLTNGNALIWFAFVAGVYVGGHVFFAKKCYPGAAMPLLVSFCVSFGFFAYGINGLRSGFALAVLLAAAVGYVRYKSRTLAIALGTLAVACHITTLISVLAFLLGHYIRKPKLFLWGWLGCFVVSLVAGGSVQALIGQYFENSEETRIAGYVLSESDQGYRVGFRWDFVLYSMVGILVPLFYRIYYRVRDKLYDTLFCAYLAANGFWLLVIRIPYSDRVAYLSWFLFPLLLLTPLVRWREIPAKGQKVALCLFAQAAFSVFMAIYQSLKISS